MGLLGTLREAFEASAQTTGDVENPSEGSYWCHDCSERTLDTAVEGEEPPTCPNCGDEMSFERSPDSTSCAC